MKEYLFIAIGGFCGAILRFYGRSIKVMPKASCELPVNTIIINILGSFLLALILTISIKSFKFNSIYFKTGITIGFLGAFTTFSTFCKETINLYYVNSLYISFMYMSFSIVGGIIASYFGIYISSLINNKFCNKL